MMKFFVSSCVTLECIRRAQYIIFCLTSLCFPVTFNNKMAFVPDTEKPSFVSYQIKNDNGMEEGGWGGSEMTRKYAPAGE